VQKYLLVYLISLPLWAATVENAPWLGTWKLKSVTPAGDPASTVKECTATIAEVAGKVRRVADGKYLSGEAYHHDTGWVAWDGNEHETHVPGQDAMVLKVRHVDARHLHIAIKFKNGARASFTFTLQDGGKSYTQTEDLTLSDGKKEHVTEVWSKQ
jgi:hypothetical protein